MAQKQVSIRLAAVGGKQVKAELVGIGTAGQSGMRTISRETAIANAKLATFASRATIAFRVVATVVVAAGVAMVRSSLESVDSQAKLAASLSTTTASIQVLARAGDLAGVSMGEIQQAMIQVTKRLSQAAQGTGPAVKALDRLNLSAERLSKMPADAKIAAIQDAIKKFIPEAQQAAVASQIFGDRAGLIFARIDSSVLRQATQDVRDFGVVVSQEDAAQIELTNDALSRLGLVWRGISNQIAVSAAPSLQSIADAMARVSNVTGPLATAIQGLFGNLDRIVAIVGTLAAALTGRLVVALGAAAFGVARLTLSLGVLKGAMTRTGIGIIAVGLGELAYRMNIFGDAADKSTEAQKRMNEAVGIYASTQGPAARAEVVASAKAFIEETKAKLSSAQAELTLAVAQKAAAQSLVDANPASRGTSSFLQVTGEAVSNLQSKIADLRGDLNFTLTQLDKLAAPVGDAAKNLGAASRNAYSLASGLGVASGQASMLSTFLSGLPGALSGAATKIAGLEASIAILAGGGNAAAAAIAKYRAELVASLPPLESMQDGQRAFIRQSIEQKVADFAATQALGAEEQKRLATLRALAKVARGGGSAPIEPPDPAGWEAVSQSLADYAKNAGDFGKGIGDSFTGAFNRAEDALRKFITGGKVDFKSMIRSMLADLAVLSLRRNILAPIADGLSGGGLIKNIFSSFLHTGGTVGAGGMSRPVPALAFVGAPRMHNGGVAGLRPDEVPAILQRGERVLSRREVAAGSRGGARTPVDITINVEGARGNAEIQQMVAIGVEAGLTEYDRKVLPMSIAQISSNPRGIG